MSDLSELIARVEAASGSDREIDVALVRAFVSDKEAALHAHYHITGYDFTGSVDAALALVERKLPRCEWGRRARNDNEDSPTMIELAWPVMVDDEWEWQFSSADDTGSTPLAIILALLRALDAQEGDR